MKPLRVSKSVVLIPIYKPENHVPSLVENIHKKTRLPIVVVDDGSTLPRHRKIFRMLSIRPYITVLSHERNKGKGAALKSGFRHIIKLFPHTRGVIMADGDGQHIPQDVAKIASEGAKRPHMMTLGSRLLHRTEMPVKSKIGNAIARGSLKFFFGVDVTDNQTGLRFVPARMLPTMATLSGNHFDYEMNMLIRAADDHVGIREVPIETVYRKKGHISHYHPWRDTFRVVLLVTVAFFSRRIYV